MISLLVDANIDGHAERLRQRLYSSEWLDYHVLVEFEFLFFQEVGLSRNAPDSEVWRLCQESGYCLLTANRNDDDADSLEAIMRQEGTINSLPVLTVANAPRMLTSTAYLDKIIEKLFDFVLNGNELRGAGRLYLP